MLARRTLLIQLSPSTSMTPTTVWMLTLGVEPLCCMLGMMSPRRSDFILCRVIKGCNVLVSCFVNDLELTCQNYGSVRGVFSNQVDQVKNISVLKLLQNGLIVCTLISLGWELTQINGPKVPALWGVRLMIWYLAQKIHFQEILTLNLS